MQHHFCAALLGLAAVLPLAVQAQAAPGITQFTNLLGSMLSGAASAPGGTATPPDKSTMARMADIQPSQAALNELQVDRACTKVQERFDVWEKLAEYGGTNAQLRLQALVASDMAHSELSDSDRRLLKYLAYTTVWVPAPLETSVGKLWAALSSSGDDTTAGRSGRTQQKALARLAARLDEVHGKIDGFPGKVSLVLDNGLRDGAFARVGGIVVVSPRFLSLMDENDSLRDVVVSHELAHLYKRHTIKELQYRLVSSAQGWQVARKLLGKLQPSGAGANPFGMFSDMLGSLTLAKDVFEFTRTSQQSYSSEQELESDTCALKWLAGHGIEPRTAWQSFATALAVPTEQPVADVSYERQHPSPDERTKNIEAALMPIQPPAPAPAARRTSPAPAPAASAPARRRR